MLVRTAGCERVPVDVERCDADVILCTTSIGAVAIDAGQDVSGCEFATLHVRHDDPAAARPAFLVDVLAAFFGLGEVGTERS
jgi:hypothetical protein